jgi:hypothetical protein
LRLLNAQAGPKAFGTACEINDVVDSCSPMMEMIACAVCGLDVCEISRKL